MAASFDTATQFRLGKIMIEDKDVTNIFFSLQIFEHCMSSAVTGTLTLVETASNQFLADNEIEGNERISISVSLPGDEYLSFEGYINRISNKVLTPEGQSTYNVEFTSSLVRENESKMITKRYQQTAPKDVVEQTINVLNERAEIPVKIDKMVSDGLPMNFIASRWHPIRNIQYVQSHGVPSIRGGTTSLNSTTNNIKEGEGKGTGSFLFFQTLKGVRFGSSVQFLRGDLGDISSGTFNYKLSSLANSMEEKRQLILTYETVQNNDTQTQQRAGAFKSRLISFDMDSGIYGEQIYESEMMTEKQKKLSPLPTRVFNRPLDNQRWNNRCDPVGMNADDQSRKYIQQSNSTINNVMDGLCQYTLPIRTDISVGDKIDINLFETSESDVAVTDRKYSGKWIVSGVAHHFLLERLAAYTRLSCLRANNQTDESSSETVSLS